jgi:phosphoadenosine phosphosulfate reductase
MFEREILAWSREGESQSAEEILRWALTGLHPHIAFASSFGAEDVVVVDMLLKLNPAARIFTLDTGRLPEETYTLMESIRRRFGATIEV